MEIIECWITWNFVDGPIRSIICLAGEVERLENEKKQIHAEYEQERIAYQKLLKDFNRMELQCENLQVGQMFFNKRSVRFTL